MKYLILLLLIANFGCQTASHKNQDNVQIALVNPYFNRRDETALEKKYREEIRLTIQSHLKEIRNCYVDSLKINPELEGKVLVEFTIDDKGTAQEAKVIEAKSSIHNDQLNNCITDAFKTWKFPATSEGKKMTTSYPLILKKHSTKK